MNTRKSSRRLFSIVLIAAALVGGYGWAKPPPATVISRAEVWASWPHPDEKYVAHEACGAPEPFKVFEEGALVEGVSLCVRVIVRQASGCTAFPTTYRKLRGTNRYRFQSVGYDSEPVACATRS
jgi:hypothetical protein